jgi:HEAT repeat protein
MLSRCLVVICIFSLFMPLAATAAGKQSEGKSWAELLGATEEVNLVSTLSPEEQQQLDEMIENLQKPNASQAKRRIIAMGQLAVPTLVQKLHEANVGQGQQIIEVLGRIGDKRALPVLVDYVEDEDKWYRCSAVHAVGRIAKKEAVPLLTASLQDESQEVCINAIQMLGTLGEPGAIPHLIDLVRDPNPLVSQQAASALVKITNGAQDFGRDWLSWQLWYEQNYAPRQENGGN